VSENALRCRELAKRFGQVRAVRGASLTLRRGSILSLLGPSGCGKTTVLRLIAGFEVPDSGWIEIGGSPVAGPSLFVPPEKRRVGMVFQDYALFPHLSVARNVAYGLTRHPQAKTRVGEVLQLVGLLGKELRHPHQLSGGEQQRVALARALAPSPALMLLDEPFSNLDAGQRVRLRTEVRRILLRAEATAVFVTHDQEEAFALADIVAVMLAGSIVQADTPQNVYGSPADPEVAAFLGETNLIPGTARGATAECELGRVPLRNPCAGPVHILLRRDSLRLRPDPEGKARVETVEFRGHYQLCTIRLRNSGIELAVRLPDTLGPQTGELVEIEPRGPAPAYPRTP
jgi:iron(III) transport system ATP-binding protein